MTILLGYIYAYLYLFGVILLIGLLQKIFRFDLEISRKIIHFLIGFVWLILYKYHAGTWHFVVTPTTFVVINYLSYKFKLFKMFEREDGAGNHYGTVYYAASIAIMSAVSLLLPQTIMPYGIAVFCLSFGDAAAALCGQYIKKGNVKITKEKSLFGTVGGVVFSLIGIGIFLCIFPVELSLLQIVLLGVASGLLELVGHGLDNFAMPFGIMALATLFLHGVSV